METTIKRYIRNENKEPRGVVVATRFGNEVKYGYSLCNTTADKFDKTKGVEIAIRRAISDKGYKMPQVPERDRAVSEALAHIEKRAIKYFKDLNIQDVALAHTKMKRPWLE